METIKTITAILVCTGIFIVLPAILMLRALDFLRKPRKEEESGIVRAVARMPVFLLGIVSILMGLAIVAWFLYNILIEEQEEYSGPKSLLGGLGIGPACIAFGTMALRASLRTPPMEDSLDDSAQDPHDQ